MAEPYNEEELTSIRASLYRSTQVSENGSSQEKELQACLHRALRYWAKMYAKDVGYLFTCVVETAAENEQLKEEIVELRQQLGSID